MKSLFASKTFWFNVIAGAVQIVDALGGIVAIPQPAGALVQTIGNILLRLITNAPVTVGRSTPS